MIRKIKNITDAVPKKHLIFWWFVRILLICCFVYSVIWLANPSGALYRADAKTKAAQAVAAFAATFAWDLFYVLGAKVWIGKINYKIQTLLCFFLIFACVIGSYLYLYEAISFYDLIMHTFSGVISAICAYEILLALFHGRESSISKPLTAVWMIMFVISIACVWEIYEFSADSLIGSDMQTHFERIAADWSINRNDFNAVFGALKATSSKAAAVSSAKVAVPQTDYALYDTMTDIISGITGGSFTTFFIIKAKFRKIADTNPQCSD